jgi:DNA-binding transcriptional ArsR family regulator
MSSDERAAADFEDGTRSDLAALRATAHPTRRAILALLGEHTTLTATESARLLGVSPKACSYHMAVLADQHLVEEVAAPGRNRPWRRADSGPPGPTGRIADDLIRGSRTRLRARIRRDDQLMGTASDAITRGAQDPVWSDAVTVHTHVASMNAAEVAEWAEDVERLTRRHVRRAAGDASSTLTAPARTPVQLLFVGFPTPH